MKLPEKIKARIYDDMVYPISETDKVVNKLIDYLKEREELQHTTCRPKEEKVHIPMEKVNYETQKIDSCACGGRGARGEHGSPKCSQYGNNDYVPIYKGITTDVKPKKIDVEELLDQYAVASQVWDDVEEMQQIINQIKDAIK